MDMTDISAAIQRDSVWFVFTNVLMQQAGLPVPAVPTLLIAGSLALSWGGLGQVLAAAVLASLLADWGWYLAGRAFGYRVLSSLCRLSINPGSCVSETEDRFMRWGAGSLVVAKFVPGFSIVAPPIAGALRMRLPSFIGAACLGALLWAGVALLGGWLLRDHVQAVIQQLDGHGTEAITLAACAFAAWLGWKFWQKQRFERLSRIPHTTPAELLAALALPEPPLLLDLRNAAMAAGAQRLPGAVPVRVEALREASAAWPKDQPLVTMCACPADATAIQAAHLLTQWGYTNVHPLKGGYDAWMAALKGGVRESAAPFRNSALP